MYTSVKFKQFTRLKCSKFTRSFYVTTRKTHGHTPHTTRKVASPKYLSGRDSLSLRLFCFLHP